jgi:hypothetical protein
LEGAVNFVTKLLVVQPGIIIRLCQIDRELEKGFDDGENQPVEQKAGPPVPSHFSFSSVNLFIDVLSCDGNCPRFITLRFTAAEVETAVAPLKARITELQAP